MRIIWLEEAERDLDRIVERIAEDNPAATLSVLATLRESPRALAEHPRFGRPGRVEGTRELGVSGLPYILPYEIRDQEIRILAVMHTSRKWPDTFENLNS
jgi:addiction module RelE/StbE family toxin